MMGWWWVDDIHSWWSTISRLVRFGELRGVRGVLCFGEPTDSRGEQMERSGTLLLSWRDRAVHWGDRGWNWCLGFYGEQRFCGSNGIQQHFIRWHGERKLSIGPSKRCLVSTGFLGSEPWENHENPSSRQVPPVMWQLASSATILIKMAQLVAMCALKLGGCGFGQREMNCLDCCSCSFGMFWMATNIGSAIALSRATAPFIFKPILF